MESLDIRDALFNRFYEVAKADSRVVMLAADYDAFGLKKFKDEFPDRFVNAGVSEQNMINMAAGLAIRGKKVFCYSIAMFMVARCYEQLKLNLCSLNLPVSLIGGGVGFSFGFDGISHHAVNDIAIMRTLPEMQIFDCADTASAEFAIDAALSLKTPQYIRLDKGVFPRLPLSDENRKTGFRVIAPLSEFNIVTCGFMVQTALAISESLQKRGIRVGVVDTFRVAPLSDQLASQVLSKSKAVFVVEENCKQGALGSAVGEMILEKDIRTKLVSFALPDKHFVEYGKREWFHKKYLLDEASLTRRIEDFCASGV